MTDPATTPPRPRVLDTAALLALARGETYAIVVTDVVLRSGGRLVVPACALSAAVAARPAAEPRLLALTEQDQVDVDDLTGAAARRVGRLLASPLDAADRTSPGRPRRARRHRALPLPGAHRRPGHPPPRRHRSDPGRGLSGMPGQPAPAVYLVTGIQAAGKSTVAQALAERLPTSVHVRGDLFRRMIVNGRADPTPDLTDEARRQLRLRYQLAATVTDTYVAAGFSVVVQDIVLEDDLPRLIGQIRSRPRYVVVLAPDPATVATREATRRKHAYDEWKIAELDRSLRRRTPRLGLWLDTSHQTPAETVTEILARASTEAVVP